MKTIFILLVGIATQYSLFGQSIKSFTLPNVTNDSGFSLSTYSNQEAIVIVFYSGECAYSEYYFDRLTSLISEFSTKSVKFVFINSNDSEFVPEESSSKMKEFVDLHDLRLPYLADKDKVIKNILMATRTPEVFILIPEKDQFSIVYQGAIDDNPQSAGDIDHAYLRENLLLLLKNNKVTVNKTRPIGCLIK